jgi:hypothetical protein
MFDIFNRERFYDDGYFLMVNFDVTLAKLTNAFMMHMLSEPEIR